MAWLDDLAPWQLVCDRHPCPILVSEVGSRQVRDIIGRDVMALRHRLRSTARSDVRWPFPSVPLSAAACIEMVAAVNTRLRLSIRVVDSGNAVFSVQNIPDGPAGR